jgi:hypothetical protein
VINEKLAADARDSWGTRARGMSAVGSRYHSTASEIPEDFTCAAVTAMFGACNSEGLSWLLLVTFVKCSVHLKQGPLSLVSTTEELLDRKVAAPV